MIRIIEIHPEGRQELVNFMSDDDFVMIGARSLSQYKNAASIGIPIRKIRLMG